jgi:hypothetical protein
MPDPVTKYIQSIPPDHAVLLQKLRDILHSSVPALEETIKWSRPVFSKGGDLAYLKAERNYVTLGFYDARPLTDPGNKLEGTGKQMRHLKVREEKDIDEKMIRAWLREILVAINK